MTWTSRSSILLLWLLAGPYVRTATAEASASAPSCTDIPACSARLAEAQRFAKAEQLGEALRAFLTLFAEYPDPRLCFSIGRLFQRQGQSAKAIAYFQRNLDSGVETDPAKIAKTKRFLEEAQAVSRQEGLGLPPPAQELPAPVQPTREMPSPPPGASVAPSSTVDAPVTNTESPIAAPRLTAVAVKPDRVPAYKRWWFWTIIGTAAAGVVIGATLGTYAREPDWADAMQLRPFP